MSEGKSTLLRCITKLDHEDSGVIDFNGTFGLVFQDFNLFPHHNVLKNITNAYKYLYDNNILHRNLGLDHVFIFFNNEEDKNNMDLLKSKIKIGNFFFSKILENNPLTSSIKGKPMYMELNMLICINKMG